MPNFVATYDCNPAIPYYGFKSWNDFFARKLRSKAVRPIASPGNPCIVTAPCEAVPYNLDKDPKFRDRFWIKSQPYSLQHLLNDETLTSRYEGGTVFQAFLNTANYHRWHVPVDGKITKAYIKQGAYYAEAASVGYDPTANTYSQRYLTHVDTRAIIMFDTKNYANVGTVIMVAVGMAEISSCEIEGSNVNKTVKKGDSLGTFKFGGSTYCLLFEKGVKVTFTAQKDPSSTERYPKLKDELQLVNSHLATIQRA